MSVGNPTTVDETPAVVPKTTDQIPEAPATSEIPVAAPAQIPATTETPAEPATEEVKKGETVVEAVPASEGVLGYKEPGFLKQFYYSKHYFWFSDEPSTAESLTAYTKSGKTNVAHDHAAWARETGQGVLFFSKRVEDKATPSGLIMLSDVSNVTKDSFDSFSMKVGTHTHRFEAATAAERDSWVVAVEKKVEEAKGLKDEITGRDSYKKNLEEYTTTPAAAAAVMKADRSKSKEPKKSMDTTTATAATTPAVATTTTPAEVGTASDDDKKKEAKKERSQSRKRSSIFGTLLGKKDERDEQKELKKEEKEAATPKSKVDDKKVEHDMKKEEKAEKKVEKKAEKEQVKEEKKIEAEQKKEEAKATHDASKATEAAEAAALTAVPAVAVAAEKKHEDKKDAETDPTSPTEKKSKRGSVFGGIFGKKVTSPTSEKTEKEAGPAVPAKDSDVPPVSETAPKLEEPIANKPIDTAAVTAPVDKIAAEPLTAEEPARETTPAAAETASTPKTEKKGGLLGFIKKTTEGKKEHKEEAKEERTAEVMAKDPVVAAAEPTTEMTETPVTKEERPAREKRRTSIFSGLGTLKKKSPETAETSEDTTATETKREKSPLPTKLGGLFRRPSKAVKSEEPKPAETTPATHETTATETPATETATEPETKIIGDVVPEALHTGVHDQVTVPEVKASA